MWGIREAQHLVPTALRAIQDFLQEIHRQEYSAKYVQLVHGMWALHLCHEVVYLREQRSKQAAVDDLTVVVPLSKPAYPTRQESGVLSRADLIQLANNGIAGVQAAAEIASGGTETAAANVTIKGQALLISRTSRRQGLGF